MKKVVIIISTGGSVLSKVLEIDEIKRSIYYIISDRECGALDVARRHNIPYKVLICKNSSEFSDKLNIFFSNIAIDMFVSFYTKLFKGEFLNSTRGKLINFHPSILPACPGLDGFGDTVRSGSQYIGSTVHFVDGGIDTGKPIFQSCTSYNPDISIEENRHKVFVQQCKMLIQIIVWLNNDRIDSRGIRDGKYMFSEFVPNLDSRLAIDFMV